MEWGGGVKFVTAYMYLYQCSGVVFRPWLRDLEDLGEHGD